MVELFANSGDPDQTPRFPASDLGLHCLPVTRLGVSSLQWVRDITKYSNELFHMTILTANVRTPFLVILSRTVYERFMFVPINKCVFTDIAISSNPIVFQ